MTIEIFNKMGYFLNLTLSNGIGWIIFPLAIATIVMLVYFEKYKDEEPGWNTHVTNSLVLLFISVALFRYIYGIDDLGSINFINYVSKFIVSIIVFLGGVVILFLNFEHFFPEKIARNLSSPLTLNLVAYIAILYVFSDINYGFEEIISLLIVFILLLIFFNLIRIFLKNIFLYIQKLKDQEEIDRIKQEKKPIKERRIQINRIKAKIKKEEKAVREKERKIVEDVFKKISRQRKKEESLKKAAKKK